MIAWQTGYWLLDIGYLHIPFLLNVQISRIHYPTANIQFPTSLGIGYWILVIGYLHIAHFWEGA